MTEDRGRPLAAHVRAALASAAQRKTGPNDRSAGHRQPAQHVRAATLAPAGQASAANPGLPDGVASAQPPAPRRPGPPFHGPLVHGPLVHGPNTLQRAENPYDKPRKSYKKTYKSPRLAEKSQTRQQTREQEANPYRRPPARADRLWDQSSRLPWDDATWTAMLRPLPRQVAGNSGVTVYQCPSCRQYVPQKRDLSGLSVATLEADFGKPANQSKVQFLGGVNHITLDHKTPWKRYIWEHAEVNDEGSPTAAGAKDAYNDIANLEALCRDCNSAKNAPKGVFD